MKLKTKKSLCRAPIGAIKQGRLRLLVVGALLGALYPASLFAAPTITYVQGADSTPQTPQTSVPVTFTAAQAAGDLNVVVVGWNDSTAAVSAVTDRSGNTYTLAVGPTVQSGTASQSIYYAKNIVAAAAGANVVTVTFSTAAVYPDIRILEYSGADTTNPVDVTAASSGNSATSSSGAVTTTNATDLIFGANLVQTVTSGPGTGFASRLLTIPDGDIAEDEMVTTAGSYSATAPLSSGQWIMQLVAFRTPSGGTSTPTVTSVAPNSGSTAGGTAVTITGTNFATGATVTFGTAAATNVVVVNSTTITATTPAGTVGAVTVTVTVSGQSGSLATGYTYAAPPTVTGVTPNTGSTGGGTTVTITGTNFVTGAIVTFGTASATNIVVVSSTSITATAPAGSAGAVTVKVTVGSQSASLTNGFTYVVVPTVTSVSPNNGSTAGGTAVTITGTNFATGATVTFGTAAATSVVVVSSTSITATTPAGSAGVVTVTVTVSGQSGGLASGYTYAAPPTVTSISPNTGSTGGGTAVTISGTNFATGATVTFGAAAATNVTVVNSTTITATAPAGSAGAVTVKVTIGSQSASLANGFTYAAIPAVTSVAPNTGSTVGGTAVTITGTNFAAGATVTFGTSAATNVVVVSGTSITATTPAGSAGAVTVTVTVSGLSGSLPSGFTYVATPTVTSVTPNTGSTAGGTSVTITGTNFVTGATVTFGTAAATSVVVASSTSITAKTPAGSAGALAVTVTVSGQSGSLASGFTYVATPTITSVTPNMGSTAGGTSVTITGTNFATGATVTFGTAAATSVVVASSTSITAKTPAGSAGAVVVTVTVSGQSGSLAGGYTYVATPTVTSVAPNAGSTGGGTAVTITGTNFATGATVTFGTAAATSVVVVSSTSITAKTPAGSAGAVTVTVTVSGQSGSLTSGFTYAAIPTVTSVAPSSGPVAGGTAVTITGTNFATGATVTFGTAAATNVVVVSSTSMTATTPAGGAGAVTVMVTVSGQSGSLASGYTYVGVPTVTSVSPNSGATTGGTAVTITGTNFATGATVTFGTAAATNIVVASSTSITATTPAGSAGAVTVKVTNTGAQSGSLANGFSYVVATAITYVQSADADPQTPQTSVPVTFAAAQVAGDLNVVAVGWNDSTATVSTVTDKSGNTYTRAVGPTVLTGVESQSIYYAKNIVAAAAGANVVTVTFSTAAVYPDIRILEYSGADPNNPVDVTAASSGNSTTSSSGAVTTTNATDLIFGANLVQTVTSGPGTGFTKRILSSPDADIAEDEMVTTTGSYSATAPLSSGQWIMQMVAFRTPSGGTSPTVTSVTPNSGATAGGTAVTIAGANFATGATVTFGAAAATNVVVVNSTSITATTPAGSAGAVTVTVTVSGQSGSLTSGYTYVAPPTVTGVSPNTGSTGGGTAVTITGTNFGTGATVTFGTTSATNVVVVSSTTITATAPAGSAGAVTVKVTIGSQSGSLTNGFTYAVVPAVTAVSPNSGPVAGGTAVTITGTNFGAGATVTFGTAAATNVVVVSSTSITATTPVGSAGAATVSVTVGGQGGSLANGFTYIGTPTVTGVAPNTGSTLGGTAVTITGTNFAAGATVVFGTAAATNVVVASSTSITATTPAGSVGAVTVTVTNLGNQSGSLAAAFTYSTAAPTAPGSLSAVDAGPAPTVAAVQGYYNSSFLTTHTTASFNSTGGDMIVLFAGSHSGVTLTPSDNFGNTWIPIGGPTNASTTMGFGLRGQLWYVQNPTVGSNHTITMSLPFAQPLVMSVIVVQGVNVASPLDAVSLIGSDNLTQTTSVLSPSITTSQANDLLIGFAKVSSGVTFLPGTGFTQQAAASSNYLDAETGPSGAPGTYAAAFTINSPESWQSVVVAAANSPNQTTLSWTVATETGGTISEYLVERCQGAGCTTFAQIGTTAATTYNDTGLSLSTSYSYRVRAKDASGNMGPYSTVVSITTPVSTPSLPSAPENLMAGGPIVVGGQSDVDGSSQTSHTSAPFNSTGGDVIVLAASSFAGVTFTPSDSFGNTWTSIAGPTSTTQGSDLRTQIWYAQNPIVGPGHTITINLSAAEPLSMSVVVGKGSNTTSPIDATSLIGSDNGTQSATIMSLPVTTTDINDLLVGFAQVSVGASFLAGSGFTEVGVASSSYFDAESSPAASPGTYAATFVASSQTWLSAVVAVANNPSATTLSWTASAEIGGTQIPGIITTYLVERCQGGGCTNFAQIASTSATTFTDSGLAGFSTYNYRVHAQDSTGATGPYSSVVTLNTPGSLPTAPGNLAAAADRQGPMDLSWTASTSSLGISDYIVQRCQGLGCTSFAQIGTSTGTTYIDSAVSASTTYGYRVQAVDNVGNLSPFSNVATNTTVGNQPPTAPSNLTATPVGNSQINLSWTASTSSIGLANYVVQRCLGAGCTNFVQIATPTGTTYSDTSLPAGSTNSYQVEAIDIEGNTSPFSNAATATTGSGATTISYVQGNSGTPQSPQTSVPVTFNAAQVAGDLNVIVVGWNDSTATISTVTDKSGNTYTRAVGPTVIAGSLSQSVYYAKNIVPAVAGANIVTVTFSVAAAYPDIRILEYSGTDPNNPVDVMAASSGSSASSSSGFATTTSAPDLIFAANTTVSSTSGPGTGFTARLLTAPDGDIAEDEMVTSISSYSATAPLGYSGNWIMQLVAFRTPPIGPTPAVSLNTTSISFGSEATGGTTSPQPVTLTNVGSAQLSIGSIAVSGGDAGDFAQINNCPAIMATNATCTINVTFTPTNAGAWSSSVLITDNAPGSPQAISLTGTGTGFAVNPAVTTLTPTQTQQFTASSGTPSWMVDGTVGGTASSGTITSGGLYTPPAAAGTHTVTATISGPQSASATVYVTNYPGTYTYHNDNLRTGQNLSETVLTQSNVNQAQFGKLNSYALDGIAFASPLYVAGVNIPGQGTHNVVYVATENDSVYAFDADGLSSNPLWHISFLKSGVTTVPCGDVGECGDIPTQYGITGTPVIDPSTGTIYLVAATKEGASTWVQRLHALDITTGAEKFGGPVVLQGSVTGTGSGSSGGRLAFSPLYENQRTGLLLNNGIVYFAFGSHGDVTPWHGWVLGYNATTLQQTLEYCVTPNGNGGGVWHGGGGLATDTTGDIYFVTSNGDFDINTGGVDYGDTVEKLTSSGSVADYFTPHDQANLSAQNLDLGAGGPVMLVDQTSGPYPHLLITSGKGGTIYVINRDNMGHFNTSSDNQIVQVLVGVLPNGSAETGNFSTPVYFNGYVYFSAVNDSLKAFQLSGGLLSSSPTSQTSTFYQVRGGSFAISANGSSNGILWSIQNNGASADNDVGNPGVLFAYNANNLAEELYDSTQAGSRDTLDYAAKFSIPLVANGKVFVAGQTQLTVFGLLP